MYNSFEIRFSVIGLKEKPTLCEQNELITNYESRA